METCINTESCILHSNVLHVFDPSVGIFYLKCMRRQWPSISSMIIYVNTQIQYNYLTYGSVIVHDTNIDCAEQLVHYWHGVMGKRRRLNIVRNTFCKSGVYLADKISEFCKCYHYPTPHIIGKVTSCVQYVADDVGVFNVNTFEDGYRHLSINYLKNNPKLYVVHQLKTFKKDSWFAVREDHDISLVTRGIPCNCESGTSVVAVEDYCKWYHLYIIQAKYTKKSGRSINVKLDINDDFMSKVEWYDHCPVPSSVVSQCIEAGYRLPKVVYLCICYRFAEDWLECDPLDIDKEYLPSFSDLHKILIYDSHDIYSNEFALPWSIDKERLNYLMRYNE